MSKFKEYAIGFADGYCCKLLCEPPRDLMIKANFIYNITDEVWVKMRYNVTPLLASTIEGQPKYIEDLLYEGKVIRDGYSYQYIQRLYS